MNIHGYVLAENEIINESKYASMSISIKTELMYSFKAMAQENNVAETRLMAEAIEAYVRAFRKPRGINET